MYEGIKKNFIENFFNRHYRYTVCACKSGLENDIALRCPFPVEWMNNDNVICINLDDNISLMFNLVWEERLSNANHGKQITTYRLIKIE